MPALFLHPEDPAGRKHPLLSHRQTVYLQGLVHRNQQIFPTVDDPGLYQVAAVCSHRKGDVPGPHLKPLAVDEIGRAERCPFAKLLAAAATESIHLLFLHAAVPKDASHLPNRHRQGLRIFALLVFLNALGETLVDRLDHLQTAGLFQGLGQSGLKGLLLLPAETYPDTSASMKPQTFLAEKQ